MPKKIELIIKEDLVLLEKLYRSSTTPLRKDRLKMLYYIKRGDYKYRSKIAKKLGRRPNTIGDWVLLYKSKGLEGLITINSGGNNTRIISDQAIDYIETQLNNPSTTITSYTELQALIASELNQNIAYGALYSHCRRKHKSKLKVSRKSHYKKDPEAEELFKKP